MNYIVTGCAGFIGSNLTEALLKQGDHVVGIDNMDPFYSLDRKRSNLEILNKFKGFHYIQSDLSESETYPKLVERGPFDGIFHLAAKAGVRPSLTDPVGYTISNIVSTVRLLEFAGQQGIKNVVIASSSSVYGARQDGPFREDDPTDKQESPYAATKKSVETMAFAMHKNTGINVSLLRYFTVFGPRVRPDLAMSKFILLMDSGRPITVFGKGESSRDYTFVGDVVAATIAAMDKVRGYEIINVGSGRTIKLMDMIKTISRVLGKEPLIDFKPQQPGDVPFTWADITKAKQLLGYSPSIEFEDAVRITAEYLLA